MLRLCILRRSPIYLCSFKAGVEYEDKRLAAPFDEAGAAAWQAVKPTTPFGQLPMLAVDGVVVCQSMTVARYMYIILIRYVIHKSETRDHRVRCQVGQICVNL